MAIEQRDYPNRELGERLLAPADAVDRCRVTVNLAESPLGWLARRGLLSERQVRAGERLRQDHGQAGLAARVTMRWDAADVGRTPGARGDSHHASLAALDARRRFERAIAHLGAGLSDIVWRIVCEGEGLADAERVLGWPTRSGKLVLGLALDRLADHYEYQNGKKTIDKRDDMD